MTIRAFELLRPKSLAEATRLLVELGEDARPIAGGTTLVILMKQRCLHYPYLVDLMGIAGLDSIRKEGEWVRIGALATHRAVECSPLIREHLPVVAETFGKIGNVRVRQTASVGGNLVHADSRLDPPPVLLILGAELVLFGPAGSRTVPIREFYRGLYETAMTPGEILVEVKIPVPVEGSRALYLKYSSLSANDWPCLGVAALLSQANGTCSELRLALGGVADGPLLVPDLGFLQGRRLSDLPLEEVLGVVDREISPASDARGSEWYKRRMAGVFVKRAIEQLKARAPV